MKPAPKKAKFAPPSVSKKDAEKMAMDAKIRAAEVNNKAASKPAPTVKPRSPDAFQAERKVIKDQLQQKLNQDSEYAAKYGVNSGSTPNTPKPSMVPVNSQAKIQNLKDSMVPVNSQVRIPNPKDGMVAANPQVRIPNPKDVAPTTPGSTPNAMPMMAPSPAVGAPAMKRGGSVRNKPAAKFSSGGSASKASSRGDGIAQRGKTKGRYI